MFKLAKEALIKFDNVCFGYEPANNILNNVTFSINRNEHVCIIGANGCGKSTLGKMIVGLFKPRSGSIYYNGKLITKSNIQLLKEATGIIFENPDNQFIGLTPEDDIAFGLENMKVSHNKMQHIINDVAKFVGIQDILTASVQDLSGGQKQLVSIASILAMNKELIIFDESTSMLDYKSKSRINKLISLLKAKGKTIITITHDMDEAALADSIIVMNKGSVALQGTPNFIFSNQMLNQLSIDKPFDYKLHDALKGGR